MAERTRQRKYKPTVPDVKPLTPAGGEFFFQDPRLKIDIKTRELVKDLKGRAYVNYVIALQHWYDFTKQMWVASSPTTPVAVYPYWYFYSAEPPPLADSGWYPNRMDARHQLMCNSQIRDSADNIINPAKEDGNLATAAKGVTPGLVMTSVVVNVTTLTDVLNRSGKGIVLFVVLNDLDNLTQNEYLRIVVDGNTVLSDTNGVDVANAPYSLWTYYSFAVDAPNLLALGSFTYNDRNMLMFRYNSSILIQDRRAAAGVSGLQVIVFEERIE